MRATQPLKLIHSDICRPMNVKTRHSDSYFLTFIDNYTRYGYVQLITHHYKALDCFKRFVAEVENQHEKSLKALRTDHGREYLSDQFKDLVSFISYELWKGEKPNLEHLCPWRSASFVHSTTHKYGKLGPTTRKHIFIRYSNSSKGYVMYGEHPNERMTEIKLHDIYFIETDFPSIGDANRDLDLYELEEDEGTLPSSSEDQDSQVHQVSKRGHIPHHHFEIEGNVLLCNAKDVDEPTSFSEALHSSDRDEWMIDMQDEMSSMDKNNVWELVDHPPGRKTIGNKWVIKVKRKANGSIDRYNACLVDLELFQMDVKTTFLNGELDEEIYMAQLMGFEVQGHERKVCRLKRSIYGLKQSSKQWYLRFHDFITSYGFEMIGEEHFGNNMDSIVVTKKWLSPTFEMKDMGDLAWLVVIRAILDLLIGEQLRGILWYLRGTIDHALCYHGRDLRLTSYSDANWASDKDERKSTSGYPFILGGGAVSWYSKKQSCIALSTMESEYVACLVAVQETVWLRRFLQTFRCYKLMQRMLYYYILIVHQP
uniref:Integrase catalytic domain-containing protein n=1 Tax=Fagus sylvatica TaxID=28930 RepID=A0A2N9F3L1_FAGSY